MAGGYFPPDVIAGAVATMEKYGVPASLTLAQWAEESGWGSSNLAQTGNNFFGVKAGSSWSGGTVQIGSNTYRAYSSAQESFEDHAKVLHNGYYKVDGLASNDVEGWINAIDGIYAENPAYASNLRKIISQYNLTQYDEGGYSYTGTGASATGSGAASGIVETILKFLAILGLGILAVLFLLSAFTGDGIGETAGDVVDLAKKAVS